MYYLYILNILKDHNILKYNIDIWSFGKTKMTLILIPKRNNITTTSKCKTKKKTLKNRIQQNKIENKITIHKLILGEISVGSSKTGEIL